MTKQFKTISFFYAYYIPMTVIRSNYAKWLKLIYSVLEYLEKDQCSLFKIEKEVGKKM